MFDKFDDRSEDLLRRLAGEAPLTPEEKEEKALQQSLEQMELPLDWENTWTGDTRADTHVDSIADGLILCLNTLAGVDIEYISAVSGYTPKECILALKGAIYQNPETWDECFYKGWETADEYLSGNLMQKLKVAEEANKRHYGYFEDNLTALRQLLPKAVSTDDIYISLGSPWVPADIIDDFIRYLFQDYRQSETPKPLQVRHDETTGSWEIPKKSRYSFGRFAVASHTTYGTRRIECLTLLERTLNMKTITVTDPVHVPGKPYGSQRVLNKGETVAALEKQKLLQEKFVYWVWRDRKRRERLEAIFTERYGCVRARRYDGSFLTLPGLSPDVTLYPYQKDAVARILFSPNTLLAHDVGAGKTYIMIAAAQELHRMGISPKNLFVVPNNLVGQWEGLYRKLYPDANLLCVTPSRFTPAKRQQVLRDIRDKEYDGIIMAYSCYELIPLSREWQIRTLEEEQRELDALLSKKNASTSRLERRRDSNAKKLLDLMGKERDNAEEVYFEQLGINTLYVDEAHNFKNVPLDTQISLVLGISKNGSKKCKAMLDKVRCVQKQNNGRGAVFATGTPITNSVTDIFVMQQYLQSGELALLDLNNFDAWIGMFAEKQTEFEVDVDTSSYRLATRFARFHNLPELTLLLGAIADFHDTSGSRELPEFRGYTDIMVPRSPSLSHYLKNISVRADKVRSRQVDRKEDNMLLITTDGRKAALDIRLIDPDEPFTNMSKVAKCAEQVYRIWYQGQDKGTTQLVFCDSSTPKPEFNLYHELKRLLVSLGIPAEEIAFVHDADTEAKRTRLFAKVQEGEIRVLIGSTFKLGLGVNVQQRLIALHHLDLPWRPADMVQREGRILRQGNTNEQVEIYRYITEGSFDAYSWQLLETKQRFISELLAGSMEDRSGSDVDDVVLNYAEVKALAIGNPLVKERVETANELTRLTTLQRKQAEAREQLEKELRQLPLRIKEQQAAIDACQADMDACPHLEYDAARRNAIRHKLREALQNNVMETTERYLLHYNGFEIRLPAGMTEKRAYIWLQGKGRYYLEMGLTEKGDLTRIDHFIDNLPRHKAMLEETLAQLEEHKRATEAERDRLPVYVEQIEETAKKLKKLDKQLGVA